METREEISPAAERADCHDEKKRFQERVERRACAKLYTTIVLPAGMHSKLAERAACGDSMVALSHTMFILRRLSLLIISRLLTQALYLGLN